MIKVGKGDCEKKLKGRKVENKLVSISFGLASRQNDKRLAYDKKSCTTNSDKKVVGLDIHIPKLIPFCLDCCRTSEMYQCNAIFSALVGEK